MIQEISIPEGFTKMIEGMEALDTEACLSALHEAPSVSIKLNRRKTSVAPGDAAAAEAATGCHGLTPVKWCGDGFYLSERPKFTLNPLMHAGVFYVQEAASMIYTPLVEKIIPELPDGPILDLCAAPGGKTTSIINAIVGSEADGRPVVANEYNPQRANILRENLLKWGYPDIVVTNAPAEAYARYAGAFSLIAVDAPCSGEGMMRKEEMARSQWSTSLVEQCAALQRDILTNAVDALAPGGFLIFSTCTINVHENEENLKWLIEETGLEPVSPSLPDEWHIPRQLCGPYPALRFLPHLTRSEGLFCAMLRKPDSSTSRRKNFSLADFKGKVLANGYPDAVKKGKDLIPAPEAPLNINFDLSQYPVYDADLDTALMYLRRETLVLPPDTPRGWVVIAYQGHPLGFVKNLGNRANNQYPKEWRIRNL